MNDLLTLEDVASVYRVTYRYARDVLVKKPDFPKPIPGSTRKNPLWLRDTLERYIRGELTHA